MKNIKKKTMSRRVFINRILFWSTNIIGAALCVLALIATFTGDVTVNKIVLPVILTVVIPMMVAYAKIVYDKECRDWKMPDD